MVPASGRLRAGPARLSDCVVCQAAALGLGGLEILQAGDLADQADVPIAHTGTIANPIVDGASIANRAQATGVRTARAAGSRLTGKG
jgi:hypothetical protein